MRRILVVLEMIKFEHTVFALPFAFLGAFLAARGLPPWETSCWILVAMAGARSAAMAFNRVVDLRLDSLNPRTKDRALPQGRVSLRFVLLFILVSSLLFVFAASRLNPLAFLLSFPALGLIFFYSYCKRFTSLSHLFLGLALSVAPVGGWVAVRGELEFTPFLIAAAVLFWVGGFDIIYACQDLEFDRRMRLYSVPARFGVSTALRVSASMHVMMILLLSYTFWILELTLISWIGLILVAVGLIYEHRLVSPQDLSRVNAAFFTVNGFISLVLFLFVGLDLWLFT